MEFDITWESVFGGLVVFLYARTRFNMPPTSRSSTTPLQYWIGATLYVGGAIVLYAVLASIPHAVLHLPVIPGIPDAAKSSIPLIVALVLTNALEIFSPLTIVDERTRELCHRIAAIPDRARTLRAHLQADSYSPPESRRAKTTTFLLDAGFEKQDVVFDDSGSPQEQWTRLTFLVQRLATFHATRAFSAFYDAHKHEIQLLEHRYREMLQPILASFATKRRIEGAPLCEAGQLLEAFRPTLHAEIEKLLQEVCDLVARGILQCSLTMRGRDREIEGLGFAVSQGEFTMDQQLAILMLISALLLSFMVLLNPALPTLSSRLTLGIAVSLSNWIAVMIAIVPKKAGWRITEPDREDFRAVKYYAAVLVASGVSASLIRVVFRLINHGSPAAVIASFSSWGPWILIDVATATMIAVSLDNKPRPGLRWLEAGTQSAGTVVVALLVDRLLVASGSPVPPLGLLLIEMSIFGFALGYCVPSWYRGAAKRSSVERLPPRVDVARRAAA
jgi:hypothetical protein